MGKQTWKAGNMLYPLPAVMVSVRGKNGEDNIITVAWAGTVCTNPPMVSISVRPERYSYQMIKESGAFVINLTTEALCYATDSSDGLTDATSDINNGLSITYNNDTGAVSTPIKALLVLTIISLAPSILIMMTSYTRIIIVMHFLRTAIGTQTAPPNQILYYVADLSAD